MVYLDSRSVSKANRLAGRSSTMRTLGLAGWGVMKSLSFTTTHPSYLLQIKPGRCVNQKGPVIRTETSCLQNGIGIQDNRTLLCLPRVAWGGREAPVEWRHAE